MARSEQQKKDLKFKLYLFAFFAILITPVLLFGPLLPQVLDSYRKKPLDPVTPERYVMIAHVQAGTMREEDALATLKEFMEKFVDESAFDFTAVNNGTAETKSKYHPNGLLYGEGPRYYNGVSGFTPWLFPQGKPAPLQAAKRDTVANAIHLYALIVEDIDRKGEGYARSSYIFNCLGNMWPKGSEYQLLGDDGYRRASIRSY